MGHGECRPIDRTINRSCETASLLYRHVHFRNRRNDGLDPGGTDKYSGDWG